MSPSMSLNRLRRAGFTLIEVMIALLIGVIGIVVMMQTFAVSEGFKRTATAGTDAQINGGVALYMLEREIRLSGYGMNALAAMGCPSVRVWNTASATGFDLHMVPFEINPVGIPAGDANTDVILIAYGTADSFVAGIPADQNLPPPNYAPTNPFTVYINKDTFKNGDLFVSVQPGGGAGGTASCVMHEATKTPAASGNCGTPPTILAGNTSIEHQTGNYLSARAGCTSVASTHNSATGIKDAGGTVVPGVKLGSGGMIFNMGVPSIKAYAIRGGNLTWCDLNVSDCTVAANFTIAVSDIVSLRAVYGMNLTPTVTALPGDGIVTWGRAPITGNVFLPSRIMAVTLEVVARSGLKEKAAVGTACDATVSATRPDRAMDWIYQTMAGAGIDLSATTATANDWMCYRHKLFQTTVPLRNNIWRP
jgi:type IV pilus assembly protein PilW